MASICDEIRIIFRGPCERLFIVYKPLGWHVCSPSGKKKFRDSLSSVVAAKFNISEDSIKFPSKLKINQKGLVIGTTDDSMYNQICKIIENKECSKGYTCIINSNLSNFFLKHKDLAINLDDSTNSTSELSGRISFNLDKYNKKSSNDPDITVDSTTNHNPHFFNFKLTNLSHFIITNNTITSSSTNSTGTASSTNITSTTNNNITNNPNTIINNTTNTNYLDPNMYSVMEIETNNKFVDKHLDQILDGLNLNIVSEYNSRLNDTCKMIQLSKIRIPHPILKDKFISSKISFPIGNLFNQL